MDDNILDGVKAPAHKRSIRDIPIPNNRKNKGSDIRTEDTIEEDFVEEKTNLERVVKKSRGNKSRMYKISGLITSVIVLVFVVMSLFSSATIEIRAKTDSIADLDERLPMVPRDNLVSETQLGYNEISIASTVSIDVEANNEEEVNEKANGTVTVYNYYSPNTQNWIKNTRFESGGLIYRSPVNVSIPGYTEGENGIIPGQTTIEIVADEVGEEYNVGSETEFKIPAFEGQDVYDLFTVVSDTAIAGGFSGVRKVVSEEDMSEAQAKLRSELNNKLEKELGSQLPSNLIALYDEDSFTYEPVVQEDNDKGATLSLTGNVNSIVVDVNDLASTIAERKLVDYRSGEEIVINNLNDMDISFVDDEGGLFLSVSGQPEFTWVVDTNKLKNNLPGKKEKEFKNIISRYKGVISASSKIFPIWKNSFPENIDKIEVVEE